MLSAAPVEALAEVLEEQQYTRLLIEPAEWE
jgi:hypothetical protein